MKMSFVEIKFPCLTRQRMLLHCFLVVSFMAWGAPAFAQTLPTQTLDLSVNPPTCKAGMSCPDLSVESLAGAIYRADFSAWSLVGSAPVVFNLNLSEPIPVVLTFNVAAGLVGGSPNSPITIMVNDKILVSQYADTNPIFHPVAWKIPRGMMIAGDNHIEINLTPDATVQYFINAVTVTSFGESQRLAIGLSLGGCRRSQSRPPPCPTSTSAPSAPARSTPQSGSTVGRSCSPFTSLSLRVRQTPQ